MFNVLLKAVVASNGELTPNFRYIAQLRQQKRYALITSLALADSYTPYIPFNNSWMFQTHLALTERPKSLQ